MSKYEGHTKGPWRAYNGHISGPLDVVLAHTALGLIMVGGKDEYRISQSEEEANARLIADAPTLLAERDQLREALAWYADELNYEPTIKSAYIDATLSAVEHDCGNKAIAALTEGGKG